MEEQSTVNSQKKGMPPYKKCLNCGADLQGGYCHECGQQASNPTPKVWEFILEYLNNAFIWDTKFFITVWHLIRRPGFLTNEFNAGKFISYENPLKLNMFFLFVFVTLFLIFSDMNKANESFDNLIKDELVRPHISLSALDGDADYSTKMKESGRDTIQLALPLKHAKEFPGIVTTIRAVTDYNGEKLDTLVASVPSVLIQDGIIICNDSAIYTFSETNAIVDEIYGLDIMSDLWRKLLDILTQYFPVIFLLTSPLLAVAVKILYLKRKKPFISFFIFALHYTALIELTILVIYLLYLTIDPSFEVLNRIMTISSISYLVVAVKNVYENRSWIKSIVKALLISLVYFLICFMTFLVIFIIATFAVV